jgi:hypothetical protein
MRVPVSATESIVAPRVIKTEAIASLKKQLHVRYKILLILCDTNVINLVMDVTCRYYNASDISKLMGHYSISFPSCVI